MPAYLEDYIMMQTVRKIMALLLALSMLVCVSGCGSEAKGSADGDKSDEKVKEPEEEKVVRMSPEELLEFAEENLSDLAPSLAAEMMMDRKYGEIEHGTYYSETLGRERGYNIMYPPEYDENQKYPVLYALHGYWGDEYSLLDQGDGAIKCREVLGNLIAEGEAVPMIIVFPDIFCHAEKEDCDGMNDENNKAYDNFINELTNDLMPYIEDTYPVLTGRENTAITGFSMGGRESLYIGCKLPDKFGYIGAVCPAPGLTTDCVSEDEMKFDEGEEPYLLMISAGTNDTVVYNNPETYHNIFTKNEVPHIWHTVPNGEHWGITIKPHLYNFLRFIFKQ